MIPDERKEDGTWLAAKTVEGVRIGCTESYMKWYAMKDRCNPLSAHRRTHPNYEGCSVAFTDFQSFTDWHVKQIGYGLGYVLDKDFLVPGNRTYGEEFCVLIPAALNLFKKARSRKFKRLPGVSEPVGGRFVSQIWRDGRVRYLGTFDTPEEASEVYEKEKRKAADVWVARLESGEFTVDPRVIAVVKGWGSNGN